MFSVKKMMFLLALLLVTLLPMMAARPTYAQDGVVEEVKEGVAVEEEVMVVEGEVANEDVEMACAFLGDGKEGVCYPTIAELDAAMGWNSLADCSNNNGRWFYLFNVRDQHYHAGHPTYWRMAYNDTGVWQRFSDNPMRRNRVSSVWNQTACTGRLHDFNTNRVLLVYPGQRINLGIVGGLNWDNIADRIYINP